MNWNNADTPADMRRAIFEIAHNRSTAAAVMSGKPDAAGLAAREGLDMSKALGLGGEDTMTVVAYLALAKLDGVSKLAYELAATRPPQALILADKLPTSPGVRNLHADLADWLEHFLATTADAVSHGVKIGIPASMLRSPMVERGRALLERLKRMET